MYQSSTRKPTLHQWDIADASSLPLPEDQRKLTDVLCIVLAFLLAVALLITAIILHDGNHLARSQYPVDSQGRVCAVETSNGSYNYPFLYFNDVTDPLGERYCVEDCPQQGVPTRCFGGGCTINYYPNYPSSSSLGPLCLPEDDTLRGLLLGKAGVGSRFNAEKGVTMALIGLGVAFGLALLWMGVVQCFPKAAVWVAFGVASVLLVIAALLCFLGANSHFVENKGLAIFFGILFLVFFGLLLFYVCLHKRQLQLCGCFLQVASDCLRENLSSLLHLLLFTALTILFIILLIYEYISFASASTPVLQGLYYSTSCNGFLLFLLVVQAVWGFSFLRDASNYVMSGIADQWYFHKLNMLCYPLRRLVCKNLGSVVGGSLLTGFFYLPALVISFLAPEVDFVVCNFFDLARSDVYAYIYLTGNSYCPSSRQTQYLCRRSRICRQNQSATAIYAFAARLAISLTAILIIYWITKDNLVDERVPLTVLAAVFMVCLYISCYFSDVHAVLAEALLVCFLSEYDLEEGWTYKEMRACPEKLARLVTDVEGRGDYAKQWQ